MCLRFLLLVAILLLALHVTPARAQGIGIEACAASEEEREALLQLWEATNQGTWESPCELADDLRYKSICTCKIGGGAPGSCVAHAQCHSLGGADDT